MDRTVKLAISCAILISLLPSQSAFSGAELPSSFRQEIEWSELVAVGEVEAPDGNPETGVMVVEVIKGENGAPIIYIDAENGAFQPGTQMLLKVPNRTITIY